MSCRKKRTKRSHNDIEQGIDSGMTEIGRKAIVDGYEKAMTVDSGGKGPGWFEEKDERTGVAPLHSHARTYGHSPHTGLAVPTQAPAVGQPGGILGGDIHGSRYGPGGQGGFSSRVVGGGTLLKASLPIEGMPIELSLGEDMFVGFTADVDRESYLKALSITDPFIDSLDRAMDETQEIIYDRTGRITVDNQMEDLWKGLDGLDADKAEQLYEQWDKRMAESYKRAQERGDQAEMNRLDVKAEGMEKGYIRWVGRNLGSNDIDRDYKKAIRGYDVIGFTKEGKRDLINSKVLSEKEADKLAKDAKKNIGHRFSSIEVHPRWKKKAEHNDIDPSLPEHLKDAIGNHAQIKMESFCHYIDMPYDSWWTESKTGFKKAVREDNPVKGAMYDGYDAIRNMKDMDKAIERLHKLASEEKDSKRKSGFTRLANKLKDSHHYREWQSTRDRTIAHHHKGKKEHNAPDYTDGRVAVKSMNKGKLPIGKQEWEKFQSKMDKELDKAKQEGNPEKYKEIQRARFFARDVMAKVRQLEAIDKEHNAPDYTDGRVAVKSMNKGKLPIGKQEWEKFQSKMDKELDKAKQEGNPEKYKEIQRARFFARDVMAKVRQLEAIDKEHNLIDDRALIKGDIVQDEKGNRYVVEAKTNRGLLVQKDGKPKLIKDHQLKDIEMVRKEHNAPDYPSSYKDEVYRSFVHAGLWASSEDDNPMDEVYDIGDVSKESEKAIRERIDKFLAENEHIIERQGISADSLGHDLFLTSRGHGAGFWDRSYGEDGEKLSDSSEKHFTSDPPMAVGGVVEFTEEY